MHKYQECVKSKTFARVPSTATMRLTFIQCLLVMTLLYV